MSDAGIEPIFVTVKEAAKALAISEWAMHQMTAGDDPQIEVRYRGTRKLVSVASLREYANALPTERPRAEPA